MSLKLPRGYYLRGGIIWMRTEPLTGMARSTGCRDMVGALAWKASRAREASAAQGEFDALWDAFATFDGPLNYFVYFVRPRASKLVKIGFTSSYRERMASLSTGAPGGLGVELVLRGDRVLEKRCHRFFAAQRVSGEWFRRDGVLARFLTEMRREPVVGEAAA